MALTKIDTTVLDVTSVSQSLAADTTTTGLKIYAQNQFALKVNAANGSLTGTVNVPNVSLTDSTTKAVNTKFVIDFINQNTYGLSTKSTGPKIFIATSQPASSTVNDIWFSI